MGTTTSGANAMTVRDSGDISFPMLPSIDFLGTDASGTLIGGAETDPIRSVVSGDYIPWS